MYFYCTNVLQLLYDSLLFLLLREPPASPLSEHCICYPQCTITPLATQSSFAACLPNIVLADVHVVDAACVCVLLGRKRPRKSAKRPARRSRRTKLTSRRRSRSTRGPQRCSPRWATPTSCSTMPVSSRADASWNPPMSRTSCLSRLFLTLVLIILPFLACSSPCGPCRSDPPSPTSFEAYALVHACIYMYAHIYKWVRVCVHLCMHVGTFCIVDKDILCGLSFDRISSEHPRSVKNHTRSTSWRTCGRSKAFSRPC